MQLCPICNIELKKFYNLKNDVLKCSDCGIEIAENADIDISFSSNLNEEKRIHALKNLRMSNFTKIIQVIKKYFNGKNIIGLEAGPGYGWFLDICKLNDIYCKGIEPEKYFFNLYNKKFEVKCGFFPDDIPSDDIYDFIIFNDVLEHIPDIRKTFSSCKEHIKEDGLLIINIPLQTGLFYKFSILLYYLGIKSYLNRMWQFDFHSPHIYYLRNNNILELAKAYNFKFLEYQKLNVLGYASLGKRIGQDKSVKPYKVYILTILITLLIPFTKIWPDTSCYYFKKINNI